MGGGNERRKRRWDEGDVDEKEEVENGGEGLLRGKSGSKDRIR